MSALYSCRLNFCLFFIFKSRQAGIFGGVVDTGKKFIGGVVDTVKKFIGGVVDTGEQFSVMSLTLAINFRLFGYF